MKLLAPLFIICCFTLKLSAQEPGLPHYPTAEEQVRMRDYLQEVKSHFQRSAPLPPSGPVRTMGEWEEIQALIITWAGHNAILREIVRHAVKETKVLIITNTPATVSDQLTNAGILLDSVQFVNTPFNSIWVRDYGPWTVYKNDVDSLFLIDWIYNRPREQDDATPIAIAEHLDIPIFEAIADPEDWVHTGGNHLPDGMGTAFSSMLVLEENTDKTEAEIDTIAKKYLGVNQYIKFPTLPYDGIHHLDMHMRLLDEETIMFGEYPDGVADGPQINANIEYLLEEFQTSFGNKYKIVRMPMPPEGTRYPDEGGDYRTYTNSIFINKTILVPTYEERYDTTALRIYKENLPGYNVVGINCNTIIPSLGALHCITKLVGTTDPLFIAHARLRDSDDASNDYPLSAIIKHKSGIDTAILYYKTSLDSVYSKLPMVLVDTLQHLWASIIPSHASGTEIHYYIYAQSKSGKEQVRPIVAPEGYFKFLIKEESINQPPVVSIISPSDGAVFDITKDSIVIEINAEDVDGIVSELVVYINEDSIGLVTSLPYGYIWHLEDAGDYQIKVRATDDKGAIVFSEPVIVTILPTTSVSDPANQFVSIFPNPVTDIAWIEAVEPIDEFWMTNSAGQKLELIKTHHEGQLGIDLSGVALGTYYINYHFEERAYSIKVIKL